MPTDPTTLSNASLRAEVAKARATLEFAGAIRRDTANKPRIVPSYAEPSDVARFTELTAEATSRGVNA